MLQLRGGCSVAASERQPGAQGEAADLRKAQPSISGSREPGAAGSSLVRADPAMNGSGLHGLTPEQRQSRRLNDALASQPSALAAAQLFGKGMRNKAVLGFVRCRQVLQKSSTGARGALANQAKSD